MKRVRESAHALGVNARADFFVLRTPLLAFSRLHCWGGTLAASTANETALPSAVASDRRRLREQLLTIYDLPDMREALLVASPAFESIYSRWRREGAPDSEQGRQIERTLARYFARMCSRCTPFGLFAGCSVGTIGIDTNLELSSSTNFRRHARLDSERVAALVAGLREHPAGKELRYVPASTGRTVGDRFMFTAVSVGGTSREFREESVELDLALSCALAAAASGVSTSRLAELLAELVPEASNAELESYVSELIVTQVLEPEIGIPVTGPEPLPAVIQALLNTDQARPIGEALQKVQRHLDALQTSPIGVGVDAYGHIGELLDSLPGTAPTGPLVQVDLVTSAKSATLSQGLVREILVGADVIRRLSRSHSPLADFKKQFVERFGAAEVPLLDLISEDFGMWKPSEALYTSRFSSQLVEGVEFPVPRETRRVPWGQRERLLLQLIEASQGGSSPEVELSPEALRTLDHEDSEFPDAFAVTATVVGGGRLMASGLSRVHVKWVCGPSGAILLGRFCHSDHELHDKVADHLRKEESLTPDCIVAEVAHCPEGRLGNVLLRPLLRKYEIVYLGKSGAKPDFQIPASDLMVSVRDSRVILRSLRLNRRVLPSITNALSVKHSTPGYEFLSRIVTDAHFSGGSFSWAPFEQLKWHPRVVMGRVVLAPQQWTLEAEDLAGLDKQSGVGLFKAFTSLRDAFGLPRRVLFVEADAALPIDFDNIQSLESVAPLLKKVGRVRLIEVLEDAENLCVQGQDGGYAHELIVPFVMQRTPSTPSRPPVRPASGREVFRPGSHWFYAKVYGSAVHQDRLIATSFRTVLNSLRSHGLLDSWFFVRYEDPDPHLRLRIRAASETISSVALPLLESAIRSLDAPNMVQRVELGTYEPEVDRYGGPIGLALAEQMFGADSDCAMALISDPPTGFDPSEWRWQLALRSTDVTLQDFGLSLAERYEHAGRAFQALSSGSIAPSGPAHLAFVRELGGRFRALRPAIDRVLGPDFPAIFPLAHAAFQRRSAATEPLVLRVVDLVKRGLLEVTLGDWLGSAIHMSSNRLFAVRGREHELAITDVLRRTYAARIARQSVSDETPERQRLREDAGRQ